MKRLQILPLGETLLTQTGSTLLSSLLARQLTIKMSCGGRGLCATCRVTIKQGAEHLSPVESRERKTLSMIAGATEQTRLSCQSRVCGEGVVLELPKGMYIERAEDLLKLLGTRAAENILHPITGQVLIPKDKLITRSLLEQSRSLEKEVERIRNRSIGAGESDSGSFSSQYGSSRFTALGSGIAPTLSDSFMSTSTLGLSTRLSVTAPAVPAKANPFVPPPVQSAPPAAPTGPRGPTSIPIVERAATLQFADLGPGVAVGKFLLLDQIGKGGAGLVYRALHTKLKMTVAVKFLRPTTAQSPRAMLERFRNEAHLLAQLNHPNVVRILDFEDDPILPHVVMEYMDGQSASDLVKQHGRLPLPQVLKILIQVSRGLESALTLGIIHRDVKPGNILVTRDWTAKLVDLGLALKVQDDEGAEAGRNIAPIEGTAGYMAPEQLTSGASVDHRSDIYSLGVTFYHLVTGRQPFTGSSRNEVFIKHLAALPQAPRDFAPDISQAASETILAMMAKHPNDRPQSYPQLIARFESLLSGESGVLRRKARSTSDSAVVTRAGSA